MPPLQSQADLLARIADALERLAPPLRPRPISTRRKRSSGAPTVARSRRSCASTGSTSRSCAASTGCATSWSTTPAGSPAPCPPTMRCCGARAAWASRRWSRRRMRRSTARSDVAGRLKLVEIHREDIEGLPALMSALREAPYRFIVFCDDLSFDAGDASYKSLKAALEGGVEGPPRQRPLLCDLQPPAHDAARHDGERARKRHQSGRGGRGEGVALRPVRPLARLPPLQPGRLSRHGHGLRQAFPARRAGPTSSKPRRSNGRRRAAPAPAARPGNSSRISPGGSASRSTLRATDDAPASTKAKGGGPFLGPAALVVPRGMMVVSRRSSKVRFCQAGAWIPSGPVRGRRDSWSDRPGSIPCAIRSGAAAR